MRILVKPCIRAGLLLAGFISVFLFTVASTCDNFRLALSSGEAGKRNGANASGGQFTGHSRRL